MTDSYLHIISLTIPFPPNFGGAIDIWYKLKALKRAGIKTVLHCFQYNRAEAPELQNLCERVYYYPRSRHIQDLVSPLPFIVVSRKSPALVNRLMQDEAPILMEGIHSTGFLHHPSLAHRQIWIRTHNVEHHYYQSLKKAERNCFKKLYFASEAHKLKAYETQTLGGRGLLTISTADQAFFEQHHPNCHLLTPFHGNEAVTSQTGSGSYLLYHGDLSISENIRSASFLAGISPRFPVKLIISGRSPSPHLKQHLKQYTNVQLVEAPTETEMDHLIREAAVILLPAQQATGFRLKLMHSLFKGRHIVASPQMVIGTDLDELCNIAYTREQWIQHIDRLVKTPFTTKMLQKRQTLLLPFSDEQKAQTLKKLIFPTDAQPL